MKALALPLLAALAVPQTAQACHQLAAQVWLCAGGTAWAEAEWDPYGDGGVLLLEDYNLGFEDDFYGHDVRDDLTTLEEQLTTYLATEAAEDGAEVLEVHSRELMEIPAGTVFRSLQFDKFEGTTPSFTALMLAEIGATRIVIYLDAGSTSNWGTLDRDSRAIMQMLRATCADTDTCASPTQSLWATE
ncbi:MAG: hypothetical protein AB8B60_06390 [Sulfitobacter sp.]